MTSLTIGPAMGPARETAAGASEQAVAWGREPDISARSALVTILGDTVAPIGGTVWLADVIALAEPFGFSERLVRTSMFRLAAEGWVSSERVGRQSRYSLTDYGREETRAAEQRIYRPRSQTWDGVWTLVFLGDRGVGDADGAGGADGDADGADGEDLTRHLRWRGFARMANGVHAHPNDSVTETRRLLDRLGIDPAPPIAAARFDGDGEAPITESGFRADSGLAEAEAAYRRFVDRYQRFNEIDADRAGGPGSPDPIEAFALRTMVVHDLRRARLRDPDLPADLLPPNWVGHRAVALAADLYRSITEPAWRWVESITGLTVAIDDMVAERFTPTDRPEPQTRLTDQGDRQ